MNIEKNTNIGERIKELVDFQGITINKFSTLTGASNSYFNKLINKGGSIGSDRIEKILRTFPSVNANWLLTGEGNMLVNENSTPTIVDDSIPKKAIPFYNLPVSAGHSLFEIEGAMKPDGYVVDLPGIGYTEAFLPVHGYSMYPEVKEGAIIGVKGTEKWDYLNTQHKYLIITRDDRMIKYIKHDKNDDNILWCISPNYEDFRILKEDIIQVYRVTFVMNPE